MSRRLWRERVVKKPRYEMEAAVSKMSPHNFLSCCLKFCTASAHLTFSEARPPTCHFKEQRGGEGTSHHGPQSHNSAAETAQHTFPSRGHHLCGPCDQRRFAPAAANTAANEPLFPALNPMGRGETGSECRLQGSALDRHRDEHAWLEGP